MDIPAQPPTNPPEAQKADSAVSEEYAVSLLTAIPDLIFVIDAQGVFVDFKAGDDEDLAMPKELFLGKHIIDVMPEPLATQMKRNVDTVIQTKQKVSFEYEMQVKGGLGFFECNMAPFGAIKAIAVVRNITKRRRAEDALRKSEERYSVILSAVREGFWDWNVPTGKAFFSTLYYTMLGYEDNEFPANYTTWKSLIHPEDVDRVEKELQQGIALDKGFAVQLRMKMKSGEWLWVSTRGKAIERDKEGRVVRMVGTLIDISGQKATELQLVKVAEALQTNEEKYRTVLDTALDAMVVTNDRDQIEIWNKAANVLFGYTKEEVIGKVLHEIVPSMEEHRMKKDRLHTFQQTGQSDVLGKILELPVQKKDGTVITVELTIGSMQLQGKWYAVGVMRDVTVRKKMEQNLKEKMEELEKMNSLMVGREMKMIELKEKIASLEKGTV